MIQIKNVKKIYDTPYGQVHALSGINLTILDGEFISIVGTSGSGKSTLMNILGLLDTPTSGEYILGGKSVGALSDDEKARIRGREIGFVFQSFHLMPRLTAMENVILPMIYTRVPYSEREERAKNALMRVNLSERIYHKPGEMSGGQQQRVAIARAIACEPNIILADEPTGNLDVNSARDVLDLLKKLNEKGKTVILITHDNEIATRAGRIIRITDGEIIKDD